MRLQADSPPFECWYHNLLMEKSALRQAGTLLARLLYATALASPRL